MAYTKLETITELKDSVKAIENLYKANCINWTGITADTEEYYTEVIADELMSHIGDFSKLKVLTRKSSYYTKSHCKIQIDNCTSNRYEEHFAKRLTGLTLDGLGLILDYQIPLKDTQDDKGLGKFDLISYNQNSKTLFLIELKYEGNSETLLRATLESYTYFNIVDTAKLLSDYSELIGDENGITVKPAVLVTSGCNAYNELLDIKKGFRPYIKALAKGFDMHYFTVECLCQQVVLE